MSIDLETLGDDRATQASAPTFAGDTTTKLEWHRPTLMRIDIKRTLYFTGSHTDTSVASPGNLT